MPRPILGQNWRHARAEDFEAKGAPVLSELVVCLDEQPNLQALGRTIPDLPPAPGYALRRDWEYVRHGTVNLLVIYNLLTGQLWGRLLARNDAAHFIPALEAYLTELPWELPACTASWITHPRISPRPRAIGSRRRKDWSGFTSLPPTHRG